MPRRLAVLCLLLSSGCAAYNPPMAGDHAAARYQVDLQRCQKQASATATQRANATPQAAVMALFASDEPRRQQVRECMQARGYRLGT